MKTMQSIFSSQRTMLVMAALAFGLALASARSAVAADAITDDNVEAAMAAAKTPADHQALAAFFTGKSNEALANVETHKRMSGLFGGKQKSSWEAHCQSLIKTYQEQAKDYAALAKEQTAVAEALEHGK
jgi:hypothetical protein